MKVAVHGRKLKNEALPFIESLFDEMQAHDFKIWVSKSFFPHLKNSKIDFERISIYKKGDLKDINFFFSIGGDGTLLESVAEVGALEIPIVGINTGRLGFLATTAKEDVRKAIRDLKSNSFTIDKRALIHLESDEDIFNGLNFGLNEVAILKKDSSSMITVHTYINGEFLNSYWADGLIIATPTGSTGYSLSCGGPVVLPRSSNFVLTPVSPHNLAVRPMIVSDKSTITFEVECRAKNVLVSIDSRSATVSAKKSLAVRKENFSAKLVMFDGYSFFETLRQKLNWGIDARN